MIRLEITDAHNHTADELRPAIAFLQQAAGITAFEPSVTLGGTPQEIQDKLQSVIASAPLALAAAPSTPTPAAPATNTAPAENATSQNPSPASGANGVELDADGLPWDGRIHSSGKSLLKSGHWRKKGGAEAPSDEVIAQVEAELRASLAGGAAPTPAPAPVAAPAAAPVPTPVPAAPAPAPVPVAPAPVAAPAPAPVEQAAPPAPADQTAQVFAKMTALQQAGLLDEGRMAWFIGQLGLSSVVLLTGRPDLAEKALSLLAQLEQPA